MSQTLTEPVAEPVLSPYRWRWAALFVVLAAEVMDLLDALVTTIAGPSIRAGLGGSESLIQWLGTGYTLAMAIGLITGGRLGDLYGRRRMFLVGLVGFVGGSVLCGLSLSPGMLIGARVVQGLFGAVLLPQGLGLIREVFPPKEVATAFGAFGPVMGLSAVGGPILAGWLVTADLLGTGWRAIFLINLPIGLLALAGALRFLPKTKGVVLGMVSSKVAQLETIDALKRRADEAAQHVDPARCAISPQCGFASTMGGNPVTEADERAKLRLCVEAARAIWGG